MGLEIADPMSDEPVKRVYAFIKDLLHQEEMLSNIVEIWDSALPLDKEEGTPSLLLPVLCCQAVGGDEDQATAIAAAWFLSTRPPGLPWVHLKPSMPPRA